MSTQTSPIRTTREDRTVITIPEARPPRRWGLIVIVTLAVLAALVLGAFAGNISQRGAIRSRDQQVAAAQASAAAAAAASNQALAQASSATALVDGLRTTLSQDEEALALAQAGQQESATQVLAIRAKIAVIRGRLTQARIAGARLTGFPLPTGRYAVRLVAVGASQIPPRVVFDVGTWLVGDAARKAAIADGVIGPNAQLPHHRYFRNRGLAWRVMSVAANARVSILNQQGKPVFRSNITQLQDILGGRGARAHALQDDPFWIVVRDGTVVSIRRQAYP